MKFVDKFIQGIKFFLIIFFILAAIVGVIITYAYLEMAIEFKLSTIESIFASLLAVIILALLIPAAIGAFFLGKSSMKQRLLAEQVQLDSHLLNIAPDSIMVHDLDGNCIYANEAAYTSRGFNKEEILKVNSQDLIAPEVKRSFVRQTDKVEKDGGGIFDSIHVRKDNSRFPVGIHCRIIKSNGRKLILSIVSDITERRKTEAELQLSAEKLKKAMNGTIETIAMTGEKRDPYTAGHQHRVAKLACAIAKEMGLSDTQIEGIRVAGILHDIGKIAIPSEILSKPGKLKDTELNLIKDHALEGYEVLRKIEFPWPVAEIVFQHHERMDGSGYPRGLTQPDIMIESAIMAVSDVVESMASHRPYRPAFPLERALLEIVQNRDTLYHAEVVNACVKLLTEKGFKFE
jgi:PAS domain S-box-containing protein/putative nucleotidyltransferase with HDIG domain